MTKFALLVMAALSAPGQAAAFGNDDRWEAGWGQGVSEAIITHGPGNEIYVSCDDSGLTNYTGIRFTLGGQSPTGDRVVLTFDNQDPESVWINDGGSISSNCRACANNFHSVIESLKRHSSVHVLFENGDSARFTLAGSAEAIGECVSDFAQ